MSRDDVSIRVLELLRDIIDDDQVAITDATIAKDIAEWDSTNHIRLMVAIEAAYDIEFETDEITEPQSVGELVTMIQRKLLR